MELPPELRSRVTQDFVPDSGDDEPDTMPISAGMKLPAKTGGKRPKPKAPRLRTTFSSAADDDAGTGTLDSMGSGVLGGPSVASTGSGSVGPSTPTERRRSSRARTSTSTRGGYGAQPAAGSGRPLTARQQQMLQQQRAQDAYDEAQQGRMMQGEYYGQAPYDAYSYYEEQPYGYGPEYYGAPYDEWTPYEIEQHQMQRAAAGAGPRGGGAYSYRGPPPGYGAYAGYPPGYGPGYGPYAPPGGEQQRPLSGQKRGRPSAAARAAQAEEQADEAMPQQQHQQQQQQQQQQAYYMPMGMQLLGPTAYGAMPTSGRSMGSTAFPPAMPAYAGAETGYSGYPQPHPSMAAYRTAPQIAAASTSAPVSSAASSASSMGSAQRSTGAPRPVAIVAGQALMTDQDFAALHTLSEMSGRRGGNLPIASEYAIAMQDDQEAPEGQLPARSALPAAVREKLPAEYLGTAPPLAVDETEGAAAPAPAAAPAAAPTDASAPTPAPTEDSSKQQASAAPVTAAADTGAAVTAVPGQQPFMPPQLAFGTGPPFGYPPQFAAGRGFPGFPPMQAFPGFHYGQGAFAPRVSPVLGPGVVGHLRMPPAKRRTTEANIADGATLAASVDAGGALLTARSVEAAMVSSPEAERQSERQRERQRELDQQMISLSRFTPLPTLPLHSPSRMMEANTSASATTDTAPGPSSEATHQDGSTSSSSASSFSSASTLPTMHSAQSTAEPVAHLPSRSGTE